METVVRLRGTVAVIGSFPALAGVDLDVGAGEVVLVRGANGAGKTTLLRVCAGLATVARGTVEVLGCDLRSDPRAVRRRVAIAGHQTGLYDELSALENARFWARAAGAPPASAEPALRRVGLEPRLDGVSVGLLSAGQRRRVALAGIVARRPELWLLDEPHAGLDAEGRDLLDQLVIDAAAAGATVILASHDLDRSRRIAGRSVTLAGGVVTRDEPVDLGADVARHVS
jgi:heme ABC exporter ATP-binding subunit CcmA